MIKIAKNEIQQQDSVDNNSLFFIYREVISLCLNRKVLKYKQEERKAGQENKEEK